LNGQPISVSRKTKLEDSIIATGFYYDRGALMERTLETLKNLFHANIRGMRRMGSATLDMCWVACGRYDGFFEYRLSSWDFAAAMLLVEKAGGITCDCQGAPLTLASRSVIASNGLIHEKLLGFVK
jgi:myo-inositol-1(or 4)-monophosphatase